MSTTLFVIFERTQIYNHQTLQMNIVSLFCRYDVFFSFITNKKAAKPRTQMKGCQNKFDILRSIKQNII